MAEKYNLFNVTDFTSQGLNPLDPTGLTVMGYGLNPNQGTGLTMEYRLSAATTTSALNAAPMDLVNVGGSLSAGVYALTTNGKMFYASSPTSSYSFIHANANTTAGGMCQYGSYLYYTSANAVGRFDLNATYADSWQALNGENPTYHPMVVFSGNLLIGDGRYVAMYDGSTFTAQALDLPANYEIRWMDVMGENVYIGAKAPQGGSSVFVWNGYSPSYLANVVIPDTVALAGIVHKNNLIAIMDNGDIRQYTGSGFATIKKLPIVNGSLITCSPFGVIGRGDSVLFTVQQTSNLDYTFFVETGVYQYNTRTGALSLKYKHNTLQEGTGTTPGAEIRAIENYGSNVITGGTSNDGSGALYDLSFDTANLQNITYILFNRIMDPAGFTKFFIKHYLAFDEFLLSSSQQKIIIKYRDGRKFNPTTTFNAGAASDTDTLSTTTKLSNFGLGLGDEVTVLAGPAAGESRHILSVSEASSPYTYELDEAFSTALTTNSMVIVRPFKKIGTITGSNSVVQQIANQQFIGRIDATEAQFKIEVRAFGSAKLKINGFSSKYKVKRSAR